MLLQEVVDQDQDALNDLDTKDRLVLKDKYEMELGTEAILTNNLAAINPNQEIISFFSSFMLAFGAGQNVSLVLTGKYNSCKCMD